MGRKKYNKLNLKLVQDSLWKQCTSIQFCTSKMSKRPGPSNKKFTGKIIMPYLMNTLRFTTWYIPEFW
jgi:hypothetical protein